MQGLHLDSLTGKLHKVADEFSASPARTIENIEQKLAPHARYLDAYFIQFDLFKDSTYLPLSVFSDFSFEDICKLRFSSSTMMDTTVEDLFERHPNFEVIRKIKNSWWRWGAGKGDWNELVDVYNGIRSFSLGLPEEFELRLDYTTGYNPYGYSQFSRTYIDGLFSFLVYYRGNHVMTISFSVMDNWRLLIQQVQLKQPTSNRWLYKLKKARMELVIDAFARSFPDFSLFVIDGQSLSAKLTAGYQIALQRVVDFFNNRVTSTTELYSEEYVANRREEMLATRVRIDHIKSETPRLTRFYADCGSYLRGQQLVVNQLTHWRLHPPR